MKDQKPSQIILIDGSEVQVKESLSHIENFMSNGYVRLTLLTSGEPILIRENNILKVKSL